MPRTARVIPEVGLFHILTRGNNRQIVFHDDEDFKAYIELLKKYKVSKDEICFVGEIKSVITILFSMCI